MKAIAFLLTATLSFAVHPARAQFTQQGSKLVGTGYLGQCYPGRPPCPNQGASVALSSDGNTLLVGGNGDDSNMGAAWVFTRSGTRWSQQAKLVGTGASGICPGTKKAPPCPGQGVSVALSSDGNTALVGGANDDGGNGAVWVFTRSSTGWTQQALLVATDFQGEARQGSSVGLSADGNTAIVGGPGDNRVGAAWIFTRNGGTWTRQGTKLAPDDVAGTFAVGQSVALSGDGSTAIIGANGGNAGAWVFTRNGAVWTQQGYRLGNDFGYSVALSADGNTAIVGDPYDSSNVGASWMFTRSGGAWTQQGPKLIGTGYVNNRIHDVRQGNGVALAADGNTAVVLGPWDDDYKGALWTFTRTNGVWSQLGSKVVASGETGNFYIASVAISADGKTAAVGAVQDENNNAQTGATWVFVRP